MNKISSKATSKVTGYVKTVERDKSGNAFQVAIETKNFESFIVADNKEGRELLENIDKKVRVNGYIAGKHFNGREIIFVKNFQIIE